VQTFRPRAADGGRLAYLPGLDGLRAIAVLAVLVYHADNAWLPGGFLGVEVFFVVSGYLITLLLLGEYEQHGRIDLGQFWLRRARRLLPALFALLAASAVTAVVFLSDEVAGLRGDLVAAFTYVTNWYLVVTDTSYFDELGRPPLLRHLWSLAVEEQFYLLWPLAVVGLVRVFGRRYDRMALVLAGGVVLSTVAMIVGYDEADPSFVYYATHTRAGGLLLGAILALYWRPQRFARRATPVPALGVIGVVGLVLLGIVHDRWDERSWVLYHGGFVVVGVLTVVVIAASVHPGSFLGPVLGNRVLRAVGVRSYGLYLWHWPVFALTRPGVDVFWPTWQVTLFRAAWTVLLTEVSFRYLETPVRQGAIGHWLDALRRRDPGARRPLAIGAVTAVALAVVGGAVVTASAAPDAAAESLRAGAAAQRAQTSLLTAVATTVPDAAATTVPDAAGPSTTIATTTTTVDPLAALPPGKIATVAWGDSVMLGAFGKLKETLGSDSYVDAKEGRYLKDAVAPLTLLRDRGKLGQAVVIALASNGPITSAQVNEVMGILSGVPRVIWVNARVPGRGWEAANNEILATAVPNFPNALLLDWKRYGDGYPAWFYNDGIHLKAPGQEAYSLIIRDYVIGKLP
jgi:peptidoglycan/LPS O-acetylase OafA/YrhL